MGKNIQESFGFLFHSQTSSHSQLLSPPSKQHAATAVQVVVVNMQESTRDDDDRVRMKEKGMVLQDKVTLLYIH